MGRWRGREMVKFIHWIWDREGAGSNPCPGSSLSLRPLLGRSASDELGVLYNYTVRRMKRKTALTRSNSLQLHSKVL